MTEPIGDGDHVVIVGAGLAGWRLCEGLRQEGYAGAITLVGAEPHLPYDRPPLSKQVLSGKWPPEHSALASAEALSELGVDAILGVPASALDVDATAVSLADGTTVTGSRVVVATGTRARALPVSATRDVFTLRTLDDVARLDEAAARLAPGSTVVVIGGGFIGAEVATSLQARGLHPIVLEALPNPLVGVLGEEAAGWLRAVPEAAGVAVRTRQEVRDVVEVPGGLEVRLGDGSGIPAALVVVGVGVLPNTEWLASSSLEVRNGVVVNESLMATATVGAMGDVARFRWRHDPFDEEVRIEHWQVAVDHAAAMAATLVHGSARPLDLVPYFWSDQYGKKIQVLGHPAPDDAVTRVLDDGNRWLAVFSRGGVVSGLLALNYPRALMLSRPLVAEHVTLDEALARAPWDV